MLCSGKVYLDLAQRRDAGGGSDVALVRLEQLYPFPADELRAALARFPADAELVWCQEEPRGAGAFNFVRSQCLDGALLPDRDGRPRLPRYVGRPEQAAAAPGIASWFREEQAALVDEAFA